MSTAVETPVAEANGQAVERIVIPLRKSCKASAAISVQQVDDLWEYAAEWTTPTGEQDGVSFEDSGDPRPTRQVAIDAATALVIEFLGESDKRIVTDCERFLEQFGDGGEAAAEAVNGHPGMADGEIALVGVYNEEDESPADEAAGPADDAAPYDTDKADAERKAEAKAEREFKRRLALATDALGDAVLELRQAERIHKAAKERYKEASGEFERIKLRGPEHHPLFDQPAKPAAESETAAPVATDAPPPADEAWRATPVADLIAHGVTEAMAKALAENGRPTIGDVADYTAGGGKLEDLPKFGPVKAEKLNDALEKWWREHPLPAACETTAEVTDVPEVEAERVEPASGEAGPVGEPATEAVE